MDPNEALQIAIQHPPTAEKIHSTLSRRLAEIWPALVLMADIAEQKGWNLYLVGGAVRDLLLDFVPTFEKESQALTDIDLVVEGASPGAGVDLAEAIQLKYPQVSAQIHGQFQTAALVWPAGNCATPSAHFAVDIATARTESYPYPAANPEVEASSLNQDLLRRDFTINAMAICLTKGVKGLPVGSLLDCSDGWSDLQQQTVRVLHRHSFIDDPTRIFRAVRFAVRLGFSIDRQTEQWIRTALSSGVYDRARASHKKTPALQSRLKAELKYMLEAPGWEASLQAIDRLGAWGCLDPALRLTPALGQQLRRLDRWLAKKIGRSFNLSQPRWLILLELLLSHLPAKSAVQVADRLNLGAESLRRLGNLHSWEAHLLAEIAHAKRPSQVYSLLKGYELCELLLIGDRHPYTLGPQIWQYIVRLSQVTSPIDGATLKRLGLQPGPQFKKILNEVHQLVLDSDLTTAQAAENYVLTHYAPNH